ncbi:MAG: aldo/keto reductase [Miltoncostaeaceae bacterium]
MPDTRPLGATGLDTSTLALGTNTFGWSADERTAHAILDAYTAGGGTHIDTAHTYPGWAPGCAGGESERMIGSWLASRPGMRERVLVATKMGMAGGRFEKGLGRDRIMRWVEGSLERLGVERIDLLYTHEDDPATPLPETLGALDELVRQGVVGHLGASNLPPERLAESLDISAREGWAPYTVLQPRYNLVDRYDFEGAMQSICVERGIAVVPYPALAGGYLTGKYRPGQPLPESVRVPGVRRHLEARGTGLLETLDAVAREVDATPSQVAVAWVAAQPAIAAVLASATSVEQVTELMGAMDLRLDGERLQRLREAAAG